MTLEDLTASLAHTNRQTLLADWRWLIDSGKLAFLRKFTAPTKFPVLLTAAGDAFLQDVRVGSIHFSDGAAGTLAVVAQSIQELEALLLEPEFVERYFSVQLVGELRRSGLSLESNQIFSFKVPLALGGELELGNVEVADIEVHFSTAGQIHRQISKLPLGASIGKISLR